MAEETLKGQCPKCGKAVQWKDNRYRPFCSDRRWPFGQRCKLIDLGNRRWPFGQWIDEEYRIPGENPSTNEKEGGRAEGGPLARGGK